MKKICMILFLMILSAIAVAKINASELPDSFNATVNSKYLNGNFCTLGGNGRHICAKEFSATNKSGKAFCTLFTKNPPYGTCKKSNWSSNNDVNNRVSATLGAVINAAKGTSETTNWDNYYYAELVINKVLHYGYTSKRGYGSNDNSIENYLAIGKKDSSFNWTKYNNYMSAANFAYDTYKNIKISISEFNYDSNNQQAKAKVICSDSKNRKINCQLRGNMKFTYTKSGESAPTTIDGSASGNYVSATLAGGVADGSTITLNVTDTHTWYKAQNYSCGSNVQSLTPEILETEPTTTSKSASISFDPNKYTLSITKKEVNSDVLVSGAVVSITRDGVAFRDNVVLEDGYYKISDLTEPGTYCVKETQAPAGYDSIVYEEGNPGSCVVINSDNRNESVSIENSRAKKKLKIKKVDENGNAIEGATIRISEFVNNSEDDDASLEEVTIEEFLSTSGIYETQHSFELGKKYRVYEYEMPKDGNAYVGKISDIEIEITDGENIVELVNTKPKIKVSKQSITSTKELPGAELIITNAQGNEMSRWTSTNKPQEVEGLADGDYTLTELTAPKGYTVAESVKFTIENGVVKGDDDNMVVMKDATIVDVPDTFNIQNVIAMISGLLLVALGTGVLFYETKKKKA